MTTYDKAHSKNQRSAGQMLLFVYDADGGAGAKIADAVHKIVSPATYACSLCAITYGALTMRKEWRLFLETVPVRKRFLYRDGLASAYPALSDTPLPCIFLEEAGTFHVLLSREELGGLSTLDDLIAELRARLMPLLRLST